MPDRHLSIFDLDHTLLSTNASFEFGRYLYSRKVFSFSRMVALVATYCFHKIGFLSLVGLHRAIFRQLFLGRPSHQILNHLQPFLNQNLKYQFYNPAILALQDAQQKKHFTAILSSSPDFLVEPIAHLLGVNTWFASRYDTDKESRFLKISKFVGGAEKADFLKELMGLQQVSKAMTTAYSDSHHDLPLLYEAGTPVAVNPSFFLRQVCQRKGWQIL